MQCCRICSKILAWSLLDHMFIFHAWCSPFQKNLTCLKKELSVAWICVFHNRSFLLYQDESVTSRIWC
uniref:Uncharacterized protein n=1 Tax=Arundo donax TaxID=35708 RepID=A0A0A8ZRW6_ARUDO